MGDSCRFKIFADFIARNYKPCKVADVAGGKGILSWELQKRGFEPTIIDPRVRYNIQRFKAIKSLFKEEFVNNFDLLIGMHPDGATEPIIRYAKKYNKKFAVVPCCVIPIDKNKKFGENEWLNYLKNIAGYKAKEAQLNIKGKNVVIFN